jgi:long-chain acyl-CoA synthetase
MEIDIELYRRHVRVSLQPAVWLSVIDIAPDHPQRTMLFVHGFGGNARQWKAQLRQYSFFNRVIAVDLRGHGQSDKPPTGYRMSQTVSDLIGVLDALGISEPVVLVGHSFGGAVASEFAAVYPEHVSHLVLIASSGEYHLNRTYRLALKLPYTTLTGIAPLTRNWLGAPPAILKTWYDQTVAGWNGWSLFRNLNVPTLVIRGHYDRVFQKQYFEEVARAIPAAVEVDVGASGHMVMLERREAVHRAIDRFLEDRRPSFSQAVQIPASTRTGGLIEQRPWLPYYDDGVPHTIAQPRVPLHNLLDSAARRFPTRTALVFEGRKVPYRRLNQEANRFANLLHSLGVQPGDRVIIILPNLPQMVVSFYGTLKAGAVAVFTLPTTNPQELIRQIRHSQASVLVTLTQFDELIYQIKAELEPSGDSPLKHIIFTHIADYLPLFKRLGLQISPTERKRHLLDIPLDARMHVYREALYSHPKTAPNLETAPNDMAAILYTGGTTDRPKGVMLSHRNLIANALQARHWMPEAREGQEKILCVVPFAHSYGLTMALNVPIALGATLILKPRFDAQDILQTIQKQHPTLFPGVPQMYVALKDFPEVRKYGISSVKACISGSAPLPVEVQEAFEKLTRGRVIEGYGLTEASPITHANPLNGQRKVGTIGIPLPSTQAKVVDLVKPEKEVARGQIGELAIRGPQVMMGYWNAPEATQRTILPDDWLLTGDVAQMDSEGYFRIIARKADMWYPEKPGNPAFPRDVEEVIYEIPQVKEAAVVIIARQPVAFIILKEERLSSEAVLAYCKRRLPPTLIPKAVIFVEDFPRSFIGKVLRRELAKRFDEHT